MTKLKKHRSDNTTFFTTSQTIKKRFRYRLHKDFQHRNLHQNLNITIAYHNNICLRCKEHNVSQIRFDNTHSRWELDTLLENIKNFYITYYDFFYINIKIRLFIASIIYISWATLSYIRRLTYSLFISQLVTITHITYATLSVCWESLSTISKESIEKSKVTRSKAV